MKTVDGNEITHDGKYTVSGWWEAYIASHQVKFKPELFAQFVGKDELVFDIGANRGGMTWAFRQLGANVIAVEPLHQIVPDRVKEFHYMFAGDDHVMLLPIAVSPDPEVTLTMPNIGSPHWIVTTASQKWVKQSAHKHLYSKSVVKKVVQAITLDDLVEKFGLPRFIKVDVEGYDGEVISTLHHPVPALNMEFHKDWLWNNWAAIRHLVTIGSYEYNYVLDNRGDMVLQDWVDGSTLMRVMESNLTESGKGSWGDIYARLKH